MPRPRVEHKNIEGIETKYCKTCDSWKHIDMFTSCQKTWDKLNTKCRECCSSSYISRVSEKRIQTRNKAREKILEWLYNNRKCVIEYYTKNSLDTKLRIYKQKKIKEAQLVKYTRICNDENLQIAVKLRQKIRNDIIKKNTTKMTTELLGCSIEYCRGYISAKFTPGMNWENCGKWHIDHIVPCDYFDFSYDVNKYRCFNYQNLQPLWAKENRSKGNILNSDAIQLIPLLQKITHDDSVSVPLVPRKTEEDELQRRGKISKNMSEFNQTSVGKELKKEAHKKRSETMEKQREELRTNLQEKKCSKCNITMSIKEFNSKKDAKDGLQSYCRTCINTRKQELRKLCRKCNITKNISCFSKHSCTADKLDDKKVYPKRSHVPDVDKLELLYNYY